MNHSPNPVRESFNPSWIVNSSPKLSSESETLSTETSGSGYPPKPPKASMIEEFGFNNQLLVVDPRRSNTGVILCKRHHAEFAGPGAAFGGILDQDCWKVILVGDLKLLTPQSAEERQRAYLIRRQWAQLIRLITDHPTPARRAQNILSYFREVFNTETIAQMPDETLALLVEAFTLLAGVLPHTIQMIIRDWLRNHSLIVNYSPKSFPESGNPSTKISGSGNPPQSPKKSPIVTMPEIFWGLNKQLLIVNSRRRNGLILYKRYHAEFAGPGAAVGGRFDQDCRLVISVGDLNLLTPESADERKRACLIRRQWVRLTMQITNNPIPEQRAQTILNQFLGFFGAETISRMLDETFALLIEALALLVGVSPHTVEMVIRDWLEKSDQ
ncbi:MAG: hypothetical protein RIB93_32575 [Coleofasciculus sp. D1-CHI-01]|uniref:hypothetical protein n=1 Tax=Coleofasciculus sp. D1-CHI-01 TaxID=3068482 RepID=UPI0032F4A5AC